MEELILAICLGLLCALTVLLFVVVIAATASGGI